LSLFSLDSVLFLLDSVGVRGVRVWTNTYLFSFKKWKRHKMNKSESLWNTVENYNDFSKLFSFSTTESNVFSFFFFLNL